MENIEQHDKKFNTDIKKKYEAKENVEENDEQDSKEKEESNATKERRG